MHGNVCEWCEDDWHASYESAPADGSPWRSEGARERVTRGGSWCMLTADCRSSARDWRASPGTRTDFMGFRICKQK
jgi:formylglycine-generating enzyme required for sulfatase activity